MGFSKDRSCAIGGGGSTDIPALCHNNSQEEDNKQKASAYPSVCSVRGCGIKIGLVFLNQTKHQHQPSSLAKEKSWVDKFKGPKSTVCYSRLR